MMTPEIRAEMRRLVLLNLWKIETVARRFGVHHSTVKRALQEAESGSLPPISRSVLDEFKPRIIQRITEAPELSAVRLLEELRQHGYKHGIAAVRRYVAQVRPQDSTHLRFPRRARRDLKRECPPSPLPGPP